MMDERAAYRAAEAIADNRVAQGRLEFLPAEVRPQNLDDAYTVQAHLNEILIERGLGDPVGYKIGCTTQVMQEYMNIHEPSFGEVFAPTVHRNSATLRHGDYVEPGVEAEIAVQLGDGLPATGAPYTRDQVVGAVEACMASVELVDARYFDYRELDTPTMVADNFFNAACILGDPLTDWRGLDLAEVQGRMNVNGETIGNGAGSLIMGHPLEALAWLANRLAERGRELKAGKFVTLGSVVTTKWVAQGDLIEVEMAGLGGVSIKFE
ncbi:MAG: hydratase [Alphaproteobacteria bacterium]|nr:hydratase [Alphaproteobacteria bacterium]